MLDENDKQWITTEIDRKLDAFDRRVESKFDALDRKIDTKLDALDSKLENAVSHLLNEIGRRAEEQMARWESIDARLTLQAGLIQSGSRAITRFSRFAENSEARWVDLDRRVRAIEDRLKGAA
jgi:tetrahydromethanopterin S-methyltransferase subunit G